MYHAHYLIQHLKSVLESAQKKVSPFDLALVLDLRLKRRLTFPMTHHEENSVLDDDLNEAL